MSRIPEETIEQIRSQTDIVDLISEYVQLTKKGRNWFGLCPFHNEHTPSFSVSEEKQLFKCFGCGASGNAITFVMDIENRPFTDALIKLAERNGIQLDSHVHNTKQDSAANRYGHMFEAHKLAANFYNHLLLHTVEGEKAMDYLEKRGFTRSDIEKYGIGWSLDDYSALTDLLQRKGFDLKEMELAGLCIMKEDGSGFFDRFRGRVMFPLHDDHGNIIAFSGRILSEGKQEAKYLNSPETPIFQKSQILYNFHNARLNVRKTGKVILFEGFMDTLSANRVQVENSVALMGTSLSETHIAKLKRIAKDIIICCDGDDAGWQAAKRFSGLLASNGVDVQIALLPGKMDPDDYIREYGGEAFRNQVIGKPHSYMSFILSYSKRGKNLSFENDVLQFVHEVLTELAGRNSPIERDLYLRQLSEETGISIEAIQQQFRKISGKQAQQTKMDSSTRTSTLPQPSSKKSSSGTERAERLLLSHLLHDGLLFSRLFDEHKQIFITDDYEAVFVRLAGFYEQFGTPDFHRFAETLEDRQLRKIVLDAAMEERDPENAEEEIHDCLRHLERYRITMKIQDKLHESKEAEKMNDHTRALELAREIIQLRKSMSVMQPESGVRRRNG